MEPGGERAQAKKSGAPKYKTLMRYKAMAVRLRQATETSDPVPTDALLAPPEGRHEAVRAILEDSRVTFASIEEELRQRLDRALRFTFCRP